MELLMPCYLRPQGPECSRQELDVILKAVAALLPGPEAGRALRCLRIMTPSPLRDLSMRCVSDLAALIGLAARTSDSPVTAGSLLGLDVSAGSVATLMAMSRAVTAKDAWAAPEAVRVGVACAVAETHPKGFPNTTAGACLFLHFQVLCNSLPATAMQSCLCDTLSRAPATLERTGGGKRQKKAPADVDALERQCLEREEGLDDDVAVFEDTVGGTD